jgi:nicotinate-nucleotide pyrophosphorylase (carboxylating)
MVSFMELREFLFQPLEGCFFRFAIRAREEGILSGVAGLSERLAEVGLEITSLLPEGYPLRPGMAVLVARGSAERVARAEEMLLGTIGKPSGVATAAAAMVRQGSRARIVCGAWKKVGAAVRAELRQAIATGGAGMRICDLPFVYLDKNYVRMLGDVGKAVDRAKSYDSERLAVVQLRGEERPIVAEAGAAVAAGADILMVDTGRLEDLRAVAAEARVGGWQGKVQLAFGGGVTVERVAEVAAAGADIVDVGRAILDAPLLDFSLDVEK